MRFRDEYFSREDRYSLGVEVGTGKYYASFPVSTGVVDYEEYYALTRDQYETFLSDRSKAVAFIEEARRHEHDDLLIQAPGWNRGTPV